MDPLISKIKQTLDEHSMVQAGDSVLLGVSGGPDSVALLWGLFELKQTLGIELLIAHLNHGVRGEESERDARLVTEMGETLQIKTFIERRELDREKAASGTSFQETARNIRQEFFERIRKQTGARKIALGHTLNDQAETVLMNLLRGSGLQGVGGMSPVRGPYVRPLFYCSRAEILSYLNDKGIPFCQDSSNEKTDYLRNRIRLDLIPYLQANYNPRILENLFETAEILRADNQLLKDLEDQEFERLVLKFDQAEGLEIDMAPFRLLPLALQRRMVRKAIEAVRGNLRKISFFHVQEVLDLFDETRKDKRLNLPDNLEVGCRGNRVEFKKIREDDSGILMKNGLNRDEELTALNIPGETLVPQAGVTLKAEIIPAAETRVFTGHANQAFLDFDKTGESIRVRFFRAGDRMRPLGMEGTKKLKSLLIDEKVPREIRPTIPILTNGENDIIWVYGMRIAHAYRVTSETSRVLFIKGLP